MLQRLHLSIEFLGNQTEKLRKQIRSYTRETKTTQKQYLTFDELFKIGRAKRGHIDGILSEQSMIVFRIFF